MYSDYLSELLLGGSMEDKKKKDNEEKEINNAPITTDDEADNDEKNIIKVKPEDLDKLLDELKRKYNLEDENIRIVKIERKKPTVKQTVLQALFTLLFDFILIIAISGYIGFADIEILSLLYVSLIFSSLELIFKWILMRYFPKLMFYSLGSISIPITIISFLVAIEIPNGISMLKTDRLILFLIIFMIVRITVNVLLMKRQREKLFNKIKGGKK
jgi:hypothetical protein